MMIFSVITVNYNSDEGLSRTSRSVINQTSQDYEWIVVDGGSSDASCDFLRNIDSQKLTWVSEKDGGIFDAMNKGIRMSSGKYCIFMNSGDEFADEHVLDKVKTLVAGKQYDLVYGDSYEEGDGRRLLKKARSIFANFYSMFTHHQSIFYRRDAIVNGYDLTYRFSADWALTTRLLQNGKTSNIYAPFPISIFERGGVSQRAEQRKQINIEHWRILRQEASLTVPVAAALWLVKTRMNIFRSYAPALYDVVRFK